MSHFLPILVGLGVLLLAPKRSLTYLGIICRTMDNPDFSNIMVHVHGCTLFKKAPLAIDFF